MYYVIENKTDVIICEDEAAVKHNESNGSGFKLVGSRKTQRGAEALANKRCEQ
ncbi:hypothetical protein [Paenibacillus sp. FSL H7-0323]|uniref:hypothetical protein n=1 Tax=Paenibacillus sp. FSL H7-0323 TaxID=2921433 RepID=UPI0030FA19F3